MITLLVYLLVLLIVFGVLYYIIGLLPIDPPFRSIAMAVLGLIFVLILLGMVFGYLPGGAPRLP